MTTSKVTVTLSGPIWEGVAYKYMDQICEEIRHGVSWETLRYLEGSTSIFKHPTGYYKSNLISHRLVDSDLITDQDVVYGPWLEWGGRGKFKGYHLWNKARLWGKRSTDRIVHEKEGEIVRRLG